MSEYSDEAIRKVAIHLGENGNCPNDLDLLDYDSSCEDCQACWIQALKGGTSHE